MNRNAILIGVAGGTGSGKTSMAKNIVRDFDPRQVVIIEQDSYYHDLSQIPMDARSHHNFDHPESYDFDLLKNQMKSILSGECVEVPIYDYKTHTRAVETISVSGQKIIVLEGIMVLFDPELRHMMDIKVYIETAADIRFIRRLVRDIKQRERSLESVIDQYLGTVRPMHEQFIEPTKQYADIIIPEGGHNTVAVDLFKTKVKSLLRLLNSETERKMP
ncbi:MAG: uridine kinase [Candidatus Marinimicrobia bacterium]|nr:uridine kinase [Candidatus Neomarinimicrobiota bacterium]